MATNGTEQSYPDADLHPTATGLAKKVVDNHQKEEPLKLYAGWFCPFVQRVWAVLEDKHIPYQYIEVNPYHEPESLMKLNPRGLVPTLEYEGKPLYESNVILELLEEAYPDHPPRLMPNDLYERARARIWADFVTSRIIPSFHRFLQYQPETHAASDKGLAQVREECLGYLMAFVREMQQEGPFFLGKAPAFIDFIIAPWALRLWVLDEFKYGSGVPVEGQGGDDDRTWARWRKWISAVEHRDSIKQTTSEREHYLPIYKRYAVNNGTGQGLNSTFKLTNQPRRMTRLNRSWRRQQGQEKGYLDNDH